MNDNLLEKAITFASQYTAITEEETRIIKHVERSTQYKIETPWTKKMPHFDVTMGSYDGAEMCELAGFHTEYTEALQKSGHNPQATFDESGTKNN